MGQLNCNQVCCAKDQTDLQLPQKQLNYSMETFEKNVSQCKTQTFFEKSETNCEISFLQDKLKKIANEEQHLELEIIQPKPKQFLIVDVEENFDEIFAAIYEIHSLQLILKNNICISANMIKLLFEKLYELKQLKELQFFIGKNILSESTITQLCLGLKKLTQLQTIKLQLQCSQQSEEVFFDEKNIEELTEALEEMKGIKRFSLNLNGNFIKSGIGYLSDSLGKLDKLQQLSLKFQNNSINSEDITQFSSCLSRFTNLIDLTLDFTNTSKKADNNLKLILRDKGLCKLCDGLKELKQLQKLNLGLRNNGIRNLGSWQFLVVLSQLTNLRKLKLDLQENQLWDKEVEGISKEIRQLKLFTLIIYLQQNKITEKSSQSLISTMAAQKFLLKGKLSFINNNIILYRHLKQSKILEKFYQYLRDKSVLNLVCYAISKNQAYPNNMINQDIIITNFAHINELF